MKKMNKLVALLLAAVMVLGMLPAMTAHAHEYHTHGAEEYPAIELDAVIPVEITEGGTSATFTFTPEVTDLYHFYSIDNGSWTDTEAYLKDAEGNELVYNDQAEWGNALGITGGNFCITYELQEGVTYILVAKMYGGSATGAFNVTLTQGHDYSSVVTREHTCTEDGVLTYTCSYCGASYEEAIPAAHTWGEDGICTICGDTYLIKGVCGDDLTWTLDWFGNMTISGTGDMYDYVYGSDNGDIPSGWYELYNYNIKKIVIEEGCTSIGDYAFTQCNQMSEVTIPSTVTDIGAYAFKNTALTEIVVPETVATLGEGAFSSNMSMTKATLPSGLVTIPANCFQFCYELSEVVWPTAVTSVGAKAFYNCNLSDLVVPEGIAFIGQAAFSANSEITVLTLPSTLAVLDEYAFSSAWSVMDFVFTGNAPVIPETAFYNVTANVWYPADNTSWTADVQQQYSGYLTWKAMCSTHTYGEWTPVDATCDDPAYRTHSCTVCGWVENVITGEALGHDFIETVIEPDCGNWQSGYTQITCSRCDYWDMKDYVPYEHNYEPSVVEATCTTDGYTLYTCSKCGNYYTDGYVAATGHVLGEWSEPTEATCTEASVKTATCSVCNETVTEEISPALGHSWGEEGVENEDGSVTYTCTVCGETYRTEGSYLYLGDNDFTITGGSGGTTKTFTAEETGKLTITISNMVYHNKQAYDNGWTDQYWQTLGISWCFSEGFFNVFLNDVNTSYTTDGDHVVTLSTIEVNAGDVVTVDFNHLEGSYYYNNDVMCNMNLALESTHTHEYTPVVTEPTCTEGGYTTYTCECGDSYTDDLTEALGHDWKGTSCLRCDAKRENPFTDVPETSFYIDAVLWAVEQGITTGTTPTTFNPNGDLQRGQVVTMLWRAAGCPEPTTAENPFTDVPETSFYYKAVLWAVEEGITNGTSATTFDPTGITNRAQAVTFLWRAEGMPEPETTENPFSDVIEGSFCYNAVLWAVENGITTGVGNGLFGTTQNCNRAQMVTFLYRTAQLPEAEEPEEPEVDAQKYIVLLKADSNGTVICDVNEAAAGEKVTFTAIPNEGYVFTQFNIFDPYGEIDLSTFDLSYGENENEYVFTMVAHDLIVDCIFEPAV